MITITLTFDTAAQAQHVLEAYAEAKGFQVAEIPAFVPQPTGAADMQQHVPTGNAAGAAAQPSTSHASTTSKAMEQLTGTNGERDSRGVVWHADYHSSSKATNNSGHWQRRRGHDRVAADAYEASFVGNSRTANGPASPTAPSVPKAAAPAPMTTPQQVIDLWNEGCNGAWITTDDEADMIREFGVSHPVGPDALASSSKMAMVYARLNLLRNNARAAA